MVKSCSSRIQTSRIQSIPVGHGLAVLEPAAQQAEVEGPAVARYAVMRVGVRPARVGEADDGGIALRLQPERDAGAQPVVVGDGLAQAPGIVVIGISDRDGFGIHVSVAGAPAKVRKELAGESAGWIARSAAHYVELSRSYLEQGIGKLP